MNDKNETTHNIKITNRRIGFVMAGDVMRVERARVNAFVFFFDKETLNFSHRKYKDKKRERKYLCNRITFDNCKLNRRQR